MHQTELTSPLPEAPSDPYVLIAANLKNPAEILALKWKECLAV